MQLQEAKRALTPAGTHIAVLYQIIDLGTQERKKMGGIIKNERTILFRWELSEEKMADGRPYSIQKYYKSSTHEKSNIAKDIKSWTGIVVDGQFDLHSLLGKPCFLTITHTRGNDGKEYDSIASVSGLPKSTKEPSVINEHVFFDLDAFDEHAFGKLTQNIQDTIKKSPEYKLAIGKPFDELNDEVPF